MKNCFWCKKESENSITMDKKEFCSAKCVSEYKEKTDGLTGKNGTCEFC